MMGLGRPPLPDGVDKSTTVLQNVVTETDDLRSTKLAFILGRRSSEKAGVGPSANLHDTSSGDPLTGFNEDQGALQGNSLYDYGFQLAINSGYAPGVPGTERFQKLCSFEYLQRYFTNVLCNKGINLGTQLTAAGRQLDPRGGNEIWKSGMMRSVTAADLARESQRQDAGARAAEVGPEIGSTLLNASMLNMPDLCTRLGMAGSDAQRGAAGLKADDPDVVIKQGIFARDQGPFLRGKGVDTDVLMGTQSSAAPQTLPGSTTGKGVDPFHVSRTAGDELAFALLERLMESRGLTDWRPDGIVLSLGTDDPSDTLSNEQLQSRDGQLFNVRIQGPAIGSSWTGDPSLETMPLDKVFVVIVADCWWGTPPAGAIADFLAKVAPANGTPTQPTIELLRKYLAARDEELSGDKLVEKSTLGGFDTAAAAAMAGNEGARLCNFRVQLATSSQMVNYSGLRFGRDGKQVLGNDKMTRDEFVRVPNQSRMGLRLGTNGGEYIVGGWCIGNVLDTSASRGSMPGTGSSIGVRTAPNSMALNINVQIDWWDPDRMWRSFMNKESKAIVKDASGVRTGDRGPATTSVVPRYVKTVEDDAITDINKAQLTPATKAAIAATKAKRKAAADAEAAKAATAAAAAAAGPP